MGVRRQVANRSPMAFLQWILPWILSWNPHQILVGCPRRAPAGGRRNRRPSASSERFNASRRRRFMTRLSLRVHRVHRGTTVRGSTTRPAHDSHSRHRPHRCDSTTPARAWGKRMRFHNPRPDIGHADAMCLWMIFPWAMMRCARGRRCDIPMRGARRCIVRPHDPGSGIGHIHA
jgi:hypothetical protein